MWHTEIRTPLTLIKCPLENVLADRELSENVRMELEIMDQNVERLLNLINQLLDFRKAENKGFKLNRKNIISVLSSTLFISISPLWQSKGELNLK